MISRFIHWFYVEIPSRILKLFKIWFLYLTDLFSVVILIRTFFSAWKRDVISTLNLSLNQKLRVWSMNLTSRFIGMAIKTATLVGYIVSIGVLLAVFAVFFFGWIGFPILIVLIFIPYA